MERLLRETGAYRLLKKEGESGGFSHAYLLVFDDARFLRAAMKTFAKLLFFCDEPLDSREKRIANLLDEESFCDCLIYPAEGKKPVVEDAERVLEESTLAPVEGDTKVFLLGDFAEANVQTQNKLLKLLEEPPKGVIFLLGATSAFPVLPTVLSRAKRLDINGFSTEEITACLRRIYKDEYEEETLALCAAASGGRVGDACNIVEGGYYNALLEGAFSLLLSPEYRLPLAVKEVGETPHKRELLTLLRLIFRDALLLKTKKNGLLLPHQRERLAKVANVYTVESLLFAQEALSTAEKEVKFNGIFSQCMELCIAKIRAKIQ